MKATIQTAKGTKTLNLSRRKSIREKCFNCSGWSFKEVEKCIFNLEYPKVCPLWPYRMGTGRQNAKARNQAIKDYCTWCMAGNKREVKRCVSVHCALFNFRIGAKSKMPRNAKTPMRARTTAPISIWLKG